MISTTTTSDSAESNAEYPGELVGSTLYDPNHVVVTADPRGEVRKVCADALWDLGSE